VFADGSLLLGQVIGTNSDGFVRHRIVATRFHPFADETDSLGVFPGDEQVIQTQADGGVFRVRTQQAPFGRAGVFAVRDGTYFVSSQDRYEIHAYEDGALQSIFGVDRHPEAVAAEDVAAFQNAMLEWLDGPNVASVRRQLEELPYPDVFPAHGVIMTDVAGHVWVQEYPKPWEASVAWSVFDDGFRWLGDVTLPAALEVYEIGEDYVLGKWRDELDVEHVGVYALLKP
jgi:hypothetical protein